jgi:small glutamine-rich tetratricopeptide repeat-containing protein alpha
LYYANRAAARTKAGEHEGAVTDAQRAVEVDPTFAKGWVRLGTAQQVRST